MLLFQDVKRHNLALEEFEETQEKSQDTLDKISETLKVLRETLANVKATTGAYKKIKDEFEKAISCRVRRYDAGSSTQEITLNGIATELSTKSHIVVLTGNGVPDIELDGHQDIKEIFTSEKFNESPEEVWKCYHELRKMLAQKTLNKTHQALASLQNFCQKSNIKFTLITQDVDGNHFKANEIVQYSSNKTDVQQNYNSRNTVQKRIRDSSPNASKTTNSKKTSPEVKEAICQSCSAQNIYEINGNVNFMHCEKNQSSKMPCPDFKNPENLVPLCPQCKAITRPHVKFFDESKDNQDKFYEEDAILTEIKSMDCLLIVGASIENKLVTKVIDMAIDKNQAIIEIGSQPTLDCENIKHLIAEPEVVILDICTLTKEKVSKLMKVKKQEKMKADLLMYRTARKKVDTTQPPQTISKTGVKVSRWV